jgi:acetoin utilization deacetylase AcuC-like enzyme
MRIVFSPAQRAHYPRNFIVSGRLRPNPEKPERIDALLASAREAGHEVLEPEDHGPGARAAVHSPEYLQFLEHIHARWRRIDGAGEEVVPNIHPNALGDGYPASAEGQAGYHMADTACPIGAETWEAACASANSAVHAASLVQADGGPVYALCRPPGHHAFASTAGGFCYLNNSAIAAQHLRRSHTRVAILDVDLHHGNGTQGIFYRRRDVLTISLHADPTRFYPFFWGYPQERGAGDGLGYNLNLPLDRGSGDETYLEVLESALVRLRAFRPGALVVALGLDAFEGDPLAGLAVTTAGFARIAAAIATLELPTVLVQEGGYLCDALGENLVSFLSSWNTEMT